MRGELAGAGFADWICHRARLLDLRGWVRSEGPEAVTIMVTGPEALVDAMEMACSLGPINVWVDRIERHARSLDSVPNGFRKI